MDVVRKSQPVTILLLLLHLDSVPRRTGTVLGGKTIEYRQQLILVPATDDDDLVIARVGLEGCQIEFRLICLDRPGEEYQRNNAEGNEQHPGDRCQPCRNNKQDQGAAYQSR